VAAKQESEDEDDDEEGQIYSNFESYKCPRRRGQEALSTA